MRKSLAQYTDAVLARRVRRQCWLTNRRAHIVGRRDGPTFQPTWWVVRTELEEKWSKFSSLSISYYPVIADNVTRWCIFQYMVTSLTCSAFYCISLLSSLCFVSPLILCLLWCFPVDTIDTSALPEIESFHSTHPSLLWLCWWNDIQPVKTCCSNFRGFCFRLTPDKLAG